MKREIFLSMIRDVFKNVTVTGVGSIKIILELRNSWNLCLCQVDWQILILGINFRMIGNTNEEKTIRNQKR